MPGATLPNPKAALLFFAGTAIFDTMRHQRAAIPTTVTFADAVRDYFQDATFMPVLAPLTTAVNTALDQGCDWTREERHSSRQRRACFHSGRLCGQYLLLREYGMMVFKVGSMAGHAARTYQALCRTAG